MDIVKLRGVIKPYEWGDSYFISSLLNRRKSNHPQGELWMGTHPMGEASLLIEETPLTQYIESHPVEVLGESHITRFGHELPFLLKVLAIKDPLSLQVHPNSEQALIGYEAEKEQRSLLEAALLNYKDNRQKDEVLFALTPVTAMIGFRALSEIVENFSLILDEKSSLFSHCSSVEEFFQTLLILDTETKESMLLSLQEYVNRDQEIEPFLFLNSKEIAKRALTLYPDDIMAFSPFFLNVAHLEVGSAIHVKPTTLHAYVYGHGVELMSASDNVLRVGLTSKKIDVKELTSTLSFHEDTIEIASVTEVSDNYYKINVDSGEFVFSYVEKGEVSVHGHNTVEIVLVLDGNGKIMWDQKEIRINKGNILLIPAVIDSYDIQNSGLIVIASVPKG
jgi:mannose-6-phosphate isomerase